jgi:hypothetical protein
MPERQTLLALFDDRDLGPTPGAGDEQIRPERHDLRHGRGNPFRRQFGECAAGCANESARDDTPRRIFWCWRCRKKFCWECFLEHSD